MSDPEQDLRHVTEGFWNKARRAVEIIDKMNAVLHQGVDQMSAGLQQFEGQIDDLTLSLHASRVMADLISSHARSVGEIANGLVDAQQQLEALYKKGGIQD